MRLLLTPHTRPFASVFYSPLTLFLPPPLCRRLRARAHQENVRKMRMGGETSLEGEIAPSPIPLPLPAASPPDVLAASPPRDERTFTFAQVQVMLQDKDAVSAGVEPPPLSPHAMPPPRDPRPPCTSPPRGALLPVTTRVATPFYERRQCLSPARQASVDATLATSYPRAGLTPGRQAAVDATCAMMHSFLANF